MGAVESQDDGGKSWMAQSKLARQETGVGGGRKGAGGVMREAGGGRAEHGRAGVGRAWQ